MNRITHTTTVTSAPSNRNNMYCGTEAREVYKSINRALS